jgi:ABC-type Zn uptake system ZnuABC Zn-binding protein ZnuA
MAELSPANASFFRERLRAFEERLVGAVARWTRAMAPYRGTRVVSYHSTFNYFLARFGLIGVGYVEERPGIPPGPAHLARLIRQMRADGVPVIFHESYHDRSTSTLVAERTGARVLVVPTSVGGVAAASSYEHLIDHLVERFVATAGSRE